MKKRTLTIVIAVLLVLAICAGIYFATRPKVMTRKKDSLLGKQQKKRNGRKKQQ